MKVKKIRLLKTFLWERKLLYLSYFILCGALALTFYLSGISFVSWLDGFCFSFLLLIIMTLYEFWRFTTHHQLLSEIKQQTDFHKYQLAILPKPKNTIEKDYYELFFQAIEQKERLYNEQTNLNQQLIDYYSMWSHQIKTPLAAMDLLVQAEPNPNPQMKAELFKMEEYLSMMLHYLKLNYVNDDLVLEVVDINQLAKKNIKKYATFFIQKNLSVNLTPFDLDVVTDEKWLNFIFEQVLFNAIKYTNTGEIAIFQEDNAIVIKDTGIGIMPEDLPRIFDKGYTGYNGRTHHKATGLGLYMSKTVAQKLNILLTVESIVAKGTSVRLIFQQTTYQPD